MANDTIVDIYCHIMPEKFSEQMTRIAPRLGNIAARLRGVKKLFDLDERFREMDQFGDYREIISLPNPPIEDLAAGDVGLELARIGNDAMAELCARHPERFPSFVAAVFMTDVEGSVREARRAVNELRTADMPDYASEKKSRFEMWWCFGWPYETSVAMVRLVLNGLLDRYPKLNIVTHHL